MGTKDRRENTAHSVSAARSRRRGFTLIEILAVVAVMAVMASAAAVSIASGTAAAKVESGVRGVVQMTRYARTMALLKQRPVRVEFSSDGKISTTVEPSNDGISADEKAEIGEPAAPVAFPAGADSSERQAAMFPAFTVSGGGGTAEDEESADAGEGGGEDDDGTGDKEERKLDGVTLEVEIMDEAGNVLSDDEILENMPSVRISESDGDGEDSGPVRTVSLLYETTGRCPSFRVTVRRAGNEDGPGRAVEVDLFGRPRLQNAEGRR